MDTFYLVWGNFNIQTAHRHKTKEDAKAEAERLAEKNTGKEFFVLQALSISKQVKPVTTIELTDLPF